MPILRICKCHPGPTGFDWSSAVSPALDYLDADLHRDSLGVVGFQTGIQNPSHPGDLDLLDEYRLVGLLLGVLHDEIVVAGDDGLHVEVLVQPLVEGGHRQFEPTALTVYEALENFESTYRRTGGLNVGSFFEPVRFEDCCECLKGFPQIEEMAPEAHLGEEYALNPERGIYRGPNASERR